MMGEDHRLPTWLQADGLIRAAFAQGDSATVARRGDADSGGLLVRLTHWHSLREGRTLLLEGSARRWRTMGEGAAGDPALSALEERLLHRDPDLWLLAWETNAADRPAALA